MSHDHGRTLTYALHVCMYAITWPSHINNAHPHIYAMCTITWPHPHIYTITYTLSHGHTLTYTPSHIHYHMAAPFITPTHQLKCERYWPQNVNECWDVGHNLRVTLLEQKPFVEYRLKVLTVTNVCYLMTHVTKHTCMT